MTEGWVQDLSFSKGNHNAYVAILSSPRQRVLAIDRVLGVDIGMSAKEKPHDIMMPFLCSIQQCCPAIGMVFELGVGASL